MPVDAARAKSLFLAASDLPDADRAAFLDRECGPDADLRGRVEALLKADADPPPDATAGHPADPVTRTHPGADAPGSPGTVTADYPGRDERVGAVVGGKYKLVEEIGEGGMGSVYLAQQTEPVKRAVAVKVIKAGMDSKAVLARFEAERQALAMMDHPNIARVLDAGTTDGGRPFFVMELVKGVPITRFCDDRKLTPRQRLELFVPVCQAIQHAHQKGVIHRDIKPSNVLVALYDDRPVPKVIDFGVAKAAGQTLTDKTLMTGFGAVVGTPEYMSPEQASLNNLDVDTRSDVYALGVLLYELLTGVTPVDRKALGKAALLEVLRIVREVEAPRPSAKLSTSDALPSVAANRGTEPAKLSRLMKGELDWVVLKALEKDRTRRYDTANGLARDIQRYLADEVVEARPPSTGYRLRKFVRRHKGQVVAAGLVLAALLAGVVGTTVGLVEARRQEAAAVRERDAADTARQAEADQRAVAETKRAEAEAARAAEAEQKRVAEEKAAESLALVGFFQDKVFAAARPKGQEGGLGKDVTLRDAIAASLPAVAKGFQDQPLVEAGLRNTLGITFSYLGEPGAAAEQFERARAICAARRGPDDPDTLASMNNLAGSYGALGRHQEALELREKVLAARRRVPGPDHPDTLRSMNNLAKSYAALGRHHEALKLREEALTAFKWVLGPDHPDTLTSMNNLAAGYDALGRHVDALKLHEEALAARERVLPPDHPDTLVSMSNLAIIYAALGRHADALKLFQEALAARRRVLPTDHPYTLGSMLGVAECLVKLKRGAEAVPLLDEWLTKAGGKVVDPKMVPTVMDARLQHFHQSGDPAGCRATAEMWEKLDRPDADSLYNAACMRAVAAGLYAKKGQPAEATADADRAMAWLTKAVAAGYRDRAHIEKDADLDTLRGRADFRALLATLPYAAPPPRPAR